MDKHILRVKPNDLLIDKCKELLHKNDMLSEIFFNETYLLSQDDCLTINELLILNEKLESLRKNGNRTYLHELLQGSVIMLPETEKPERNPDLEKRCSRLREQQDNYFYKKMTKNVNSQKNKEMEDTFAYQMKQMNNALILAFQFVVSVLCGFAFGFLGVSIFVGEMDTGIRILLGILCTIIIGIAELYFIVKQFNNY